MDTPYASPFDRATSPEWAACEAIGAEYGCCPVADRLIDCMDTCETPRKLIELAEAMRAHAGSVCAHCGGTRDSVLDERLGMRSPGAVCCEGKAA